jgi:hypothetical protein
MVDYKAVARKKVGQKKIEVRKNLVNIPNLGESTFRIMEKMLKIR